jgi:hypothetical protein
MARIRDVAQQTRLRSRQIELILGYHKVLTGLKGVAFAAL